MLQTISGWRDENGRGQEDYHCMWANQICPGVNKQGKYYLGRCLRLWTSNWPTGL